MKDKNKESYWGMKMRIENEDKNEESWWGIRVRNEEWGMRNEEWGMRNEEWGIRISMRKINSEIWSDKKL